MPSRLPLSVTFCAVLGIAPAFAQWTDPPPYVPPATPGPSGEMPSSGARADKIEGLPPQELPSPLRRSEKASGQFPNATGWRPGSKAIKQVEPEKESPVPKSITRESSVASGVIPPLTIVEDTARQAFARYLSFWSVTDTVTRDAMQAFYDPSVRFYGRLVDIEEVARQKRAFVARWPVRDYAAVLESVDAHCRDDGQFCDVEGEFTFRAANPGRGQSSNGVGLLNLRFAFTGSGPRIVEERSRVLSRGRVPSLETGTEDAIGD